jgi:hypothetical protein
MAVDFPSSPVLNDTYSVGNYTWKWNGQGWENVTSTFGPTGPTGPIGPQGSAGGFTFSNTAPASPNTGDRWVNTQNGVEYTYTYDGNSYQWIQLTPAKSGPTGAQGIQGSTIIVGQFDGGFPYSIYGGVTSVNAGGVV